jgi:hypothetical protein
VQQDLQSVDCALFIFQFAAQADDDGFQSVDFAAGWGLPAQGSKASTHTS